MVPQRVVPPEPRLLRELRGTVRADLRSAGLDDRVVDDAVLCMHEACLNAIQHGSGDVHVHWEVNDGEVRVEVGDHGPGPSLAGRARPPAPDRQSGRGLFLIGRLADRMETGARGPLHYIAFALRPARAHPGPSPAGSGRGAPQPTACIASLAVPGQAC